MSEALKKSTQITSVTEEEEADSNAIEEDEIASSKGGRVVSDGVASQ